MLVTDDLVLKVADFGLARKVYDSIYRPSGVSPTYDPSPHPTPTPPPPSLQELVHDDYNNDFSAGKSAHQVDGSGDDPRQRVHHTERRVSHLGQISDMVAQGGASDDPVAIASVAPGGPLVSCCGR